MKASNSNKPKPFLDQLLESKQKLPIKIKTTPKIIDYNEERLNTLDFIEYFIDLSGVFNPQCNLAWVKSPLTQKSLFFDNFELRKNQKNPILKENPPLFKEDPSIKSHPFENIKEKGHFQQKNDFFIPLKKENPHKNSSNKPNKDLSIVESPLFDSGDIKESILEGPLSQKNSFFELWHQKQANIHKNPDKPVFINQKLLFSSQSPNNSNISLEKQNNSVISQKNIEKPSSIDKKSSFQKEKDITISNPKLLTPNTPIETTKKELMYSYHLKQNPQFTHLIRQHTPETQRNPLIQRDHSTPTETRKISRTPPRNLIQYQRSLMQKEQNNEGPFIQEKTSLLNEPFQSKKDHFLNKNELLQNKKDLLSHKNELFPIKKDSSIIKTPKKQRIENKWLKKEEIFSNKQDSFIYKKPISMKLDLNKFAKKDPSPYKSTKPSNILVSQRAFFNK